MLLLAFGNKARHGKDSCAQAIIDYYHRRNELLKKHGLYVPPLTVKIYKFAEALYEECRIEHGMTEKDPPLLQRIGAWRRETDPYYWVDRIFAKIRSEKPDIALITDVRYQNEAATVKENRGYMIGVSRLNSDGSLFIAPDRDPHHLSETDLDDYNWDARIVVHEGDQALRSELAVTIAEYYRSLHV